MSSIQSALLHFIVHVVGGLFLYVGYFVASLLKVYFKPLFWAVVLSIPLYDIKKLILEYVEEDLQDDEITLIGVGQTTVHVLCQWAFDPIYSILRLGASVYSRLVHRALGIEAVEKAEMEPLSPASGKDLAEKTLAEQQAIVSSQLESHLHKGTFVYFKWTLRFGNAIVLYDLLYNKQLTGLFAILVCVAMGQYLLYHVARRYLGPYMPFQATKSFVLNNANSLLTNILVLGSLGFLFVGTIVLVLVSLQEVQQLFQATMQLVDTHLQGELREQYHAQLEQLYDYGVDYANGLHVLQSNQLTVADISQKVQGYRTDNVDLLLNHLHGGTYSALVNSTLLTSIWNEWQNATLSDSEASFVMNLKESLSSLGSMVAEHLLGIVMWLMGAFMWLIDGLIQGTMFLTVLTVLVGNTHDMIYYVRTSLSAMDPKALIADSLDGCVTSIFSVNLRLGLFYFIFTWVSFYACGLISVLPAMMASCLAMLPLVTPMVIAVVPSLVLYLQGSYLKAIGLMSSHVYVAFFVIPLFYKEIRGVNTYMLSLSIVLGLYTYGLEGVFLGPVSLSLLGAGYQFINCYMK